MSDSDVIGAFILAGITSVASVAAWLDLRRKGKADERLLPLPA